MFVLIDRKLLLEFLFIWPYMYTFLSSKSNNLLLNNVISRCFAVIGIFEATRYIIDYLKAN